MTFTTKTVKNEEKPRTASPYIGYGVQELKINSFAVEKASTGSKRVVFHVEGRPVTSENFQGVDGAKGPVGRIRTIYLKSDDAKKEFVSNLAKIADAMGVRDRFDEIEADNFDDYLDKLAENGGSIFKGNFARFVVATTRQITTIDGKDKIKDRFSFPRYNFVESVEKDNGLTFDKTKAYHYKEERMEAPDMEAVAVTGKEDLPF